jgi:hypothetical protein
MEVPNTNKFANKYPPLAPPKRGTVSDYYLNFDNINLMKTEVSTNSNFAINNVLLPSWEGIKGWVLR